MIKRIFNVIYGILILLGVIFVVGTWIKNSPSNTTNYSYKVVCDNGKTFDPTSKPINETGKSSYNHRYIYKDRLFDFDENQIKAECEYGTAASDWKIYNQPKNYTLYVKKSANSLFDQLKFTIISLLLYYLPLEVIRRTFLYIVYGKSFFVIKDKKNK